MKQISTTIIILAFSFASSAQNVGIGEFTPTEAKLQVRAGDSALLLLHSNPRPQLGNTNPIKTGLFFKAADSYSGSVATIGLGNSYRLGFFTNAGPTPDVLAERMSISDAGNVGIGNISPAFKLDITGSLRTTSNAQFGGLLTANNGLSVVGSAAVNGNVTATGILNSNAMAVAGNATIGGILKINSGSPGDGKVLTSDAAGNATWEKTAYGNTERFMFRINNNNYTFTTCYNFGSATATATMGEYSMVINIVKSGLYHFDINMNVVFSGIDFSPTAPNSLAAINQLEIVAVNSNNNFKSETYQPFVRKGGVGLLAASSLSSIDKTCEFYITAPCAVGIYSNYRFNASNFTVAGHLISE